MLIRLSILKEHTIDKIDYFVHNRYNNCVRLADSGKANSILDDFFNRSKHLDNQDFVKNQYKKFSDSQICTVLRKFDLLSNTFLFRAFNKISKGKFGRFYFKRLYLKRKSYDLQNILECEAWYEMALQVVKDYNNEK